MKLKREHSVVFGNSAGFLRKLLVFALFFACFYAGAQNYSVTSGNTPGGAIPNGIPDAAEAETGNGTSGRFIVTRQLNAFGPVVVNYNVTGTATPRNAANPNGDYVELSGQVIFADQNQDFAEIVVDVLPDDFVENNETVTVTLTSATPGTGAVSATPATVTISDITDVGTFSLDLTEPAFIPNAAEEGPTNGRFRIVLDKPNGSSAPATIDYTLSGTAASGADYTVTGAVVMTFANNETQVARNLNILPVDDDVLEDAETVILTLNSVDNPLFRIGTPNTAEIIIEDNDCASGDVAPVLNNNPTTFCDDFSIGLDTYYDGARPPGASLIWTTNNADPLNQADWAPTTGDTVVSAPGSYYAFFWDEPNNCNSPTVELVLTRTDSPSAGTVTTPVSACSNDTNEFGPNRVDLDGLIEDEDDGAWSQTGGPDLGNLPNNNDIDFRGQPAGSYEFTYTTDTAVAPCTNATSVVTITVTDCDPCEAGNAAPVLNTEVPRTFCDDITTSLNDYAPATGPNGTVLRWATSSDNPTENFVPANRIADPLEGTYFGFYYDSTNDCASPLLTLSLVQNTTPEITSATGNSSCGTGALQLRATANEDATIRWFSRPTGGAVLQTGPNFTTPSIAATTSYYVEGVANGCTSPRTEVVAEVLPQPSAGAPENTSSCNNSDFGVTVLDLDDTFTGTADAGVWSFTSGPTPITLSAENVVDFQGSANGAYVFTYTTSEAQAPCENESAEITISVSSCDTDDDNDGLLGGLESQLGTDPNNPDTDGDGINDGVEVGDDTENPLDVDEDGIIDALDSNVLDTDEDGVVDQIDPANENACIPD
ncbi:MAG: Calx-beta domain-containing protein, partial [Pricia sp.]